jgi:sugar phosphate isomerase/epimerase
VLALSLPSSYFCGSCSRDVDDAGVWHSLLGPPPGALAQLAELGVHAIEISDVRGRSDAAAVARALQQVIDAGLRPHAHLYLPRGFDPARPPEQLVAAARGLDRSRHLRVGLAACAVHGHHRDSPDAAAATVRDLRAVDSWLRDHGARAALEVCRYRSQGPFGGTYAETLGLARAAGDGVALTWDVGHTTWNHEQDFDVAWPDAGFLERVRHVHVHAIGETGRTHFPLGRGRVPLEAFVERLRGVGYDGLWGLELYPLRWQSSPADGRRALEASISRLAEALA